MIKEIILCGAQGSQDVIKPIYDRITSKITESETKDVGVCMTEERPYTRSYTQISPLVVYIKVDFGTRYEAILSHLKSVKDACLSVVMSTRDFENFDNEADLVFDVKPDTNLDRMADVIFDCALNRNEEQSEDRD